ncbi:hypothetical protein [Streptomyces sp. TS71-3]|uniref:hypothetical protein n=1 Tax=Streptomyces sp. TS71-3 TaxID=2733862 RepID=UPI0027E2F615|nr:hypothetical protein [Streptomyces sp. TS71-3]
MISADDSSVLVASWSSRPRPWRERGELVDLPSAVLAAGRAAGLTPSERCVALLAGIRDSRLISRPSFFQMKNVHDARRQGIPLTVIQHEDVLVFTRPGLAPPGSGCGTPSSAKWPKFAKRTSHVTQAWPSGSNTPRGGRGVR